MDHTLFCIHPSASPKSQIQKMHHQKNSHFVTFSSLFRGQRRMNANHDLKTKTLIHSRISNFWQYCKFLLGVFFCPLQLGDFLAIPRVFAWGGIYCPLQSFEKRTIYQPHQQLCLQLLYFTNSSLLYLLTSLKCNTNFFTSPIARIVIPEPHCNS